MLHLPEHNWKTKYYIGYEYIGYIGYLGVEKTIGHKYGLTGFCIKLYSEIHALIEGSQFKFKSALDFPTS